MNQPYLDLKNFIGSFILEVAMLILTRKTGESLLVGDDVEITVLSVRGSQVKLGVNAPKKNIDCIGACRSFYCINGAGF